MNTTPTAKNVNAYLREMIASNPNSPSQDSGEIAATLLEQILGVTSFDDYVEELQREYWPEWYGVPPAQRWAGPSWIVGRA